MVGVKNQSSVLTIALWNNLPGTEFSLASGSASLGGISALNHGSKFDSSLWVRLWSVHVSSFWVPAQRVTSYSQEALLMLMAEA